MKNRRRTSIHTRYVFSHTYARGTCAIRDRPHERRNARVVRMHVVHRTQYRVPIGVTVRCIRGTRAAIPGVHREARLIAASKLAIGPAVIDLRLIADRKNAL